jgi:tetratricopeptide (TPR) repeat protein
MANDSPTQSPIQNSQFSVSHFTFDSPSAPSAPSAVKDSSPDLNPKSEIANPKSTGSALHIPHFLMGFLVLAAAVAAFQPAIHNTLTHDDILQVNYWPTSPTKDIRSDIFQPWWPADRGKHDWRPLTRFSILLQKDWLEQTGSDAVRPYYVSNIATHAVVCLLLYILAVRWRIDRRAALVAALLFAVHPLHAEAVHQIVGRAELLAAAWMLLGLVLWTRWGPFSPGTLAVQAYIFLFALGSKEHAILYPLYLALASLTAPVGQLPTDPGWRRWRETNQTGLIHRLFHHFLFVVTGFLALKWHIAGGLGVSTAAVPATENPLVHMPFLDRLPAALGIFGYAVVTFFWPASLAPDYAAVSLPFDQAWHWPYAIVGALLLALLFVYAVVNAARGGRAWALVAGGLCAWLLTSNLFFPIGIAAAPRLWYWPSAALCLGVGWLAVKLLDALPDRPRRLALPLAPAVVVLLLLVVAWRDAPAWRSPRAFAEATLDVFPDNWRANVNLSREAWLAKDFETGLVHAERAMTAFPDEAIGWGWYGANAMFIPGREGVAESALRNAISLNPALPETRRNLANLLRMQNRHPEAEQILQSIP